MIQNGRILLVEDDAKDVELTLTALERFNLRNEVFVVNDGEEALDYLYRRGKFRLRLPHHPVVILLDLKMPKISGLDVLKQLKADAELKTIPVVVVTSSREEPDIRQAYALGVNAYVVKPVDFPQFLDAVSQVGLFWAIVNEPPPGILL